MSSNRRHGVVPPKGPKLIESDNLQERFGAVGTMGHDVRLQIVGTSECNDPQRPTSDIPVKSLVRTKV